MILPPIVLHAILLTTYGLWNINWSGKIEKVFENIHDDRPRSENSGIQVHRLEMDLKGKTYNINNKKFRMNVKKVSDK